MALALRWPIAASVVIYLASRLVVLAGVLLGPKLIPLKVSDAPGLFAAGDIQLLLQYDALHYLTIARDGYSSVGAPLLKSNVVFYPLYPLLVRVTSMMTGWSLADTLLIIAHLAAILAVIMLADLVRRDHDSETALVTVALFSFYPTSLFLSSGYAESLAILFCLSAFWALRTERIALGAVMIALMLATRSTGIVMMPILLFAIWRSNRFAVWPTLLQSALFGTVAVSGLLAYMGYLWMFHGDPFLFSSTQNAWNSGMGFPERFRNALMLTPFYTGFSIGTLHFIATIGLLALGWKCIKPDLLFYGVVSMLLPYFSLSGGAAALTSMSRFALMAFPAMMVLAVMLPRRPGVLGPVLGGSAFVLLCYVAFFVQSHWIG